MGVVSGKAIHCPVEYPIEMDMYIAICVLLWVGRVQYVILQYAYYCG